MISVITPTVTGGLNHLVKLLPSLEKEPDKEIIIIDNQSKDGSSTYVANHDCIVVYNKIKKNFSQSNNQGASLARGEYLLFMNNDIKINDGLLEAMRKVYDTQENVGAVGCLLYLMEHPHNIQHCGVMFTNEYIPYELGLEHPFGVPALKKNDPKVISVREVPSVTAACVMIKRDLFLSLGGFDEAFVNGWEDTDLMLRIREKGYKIYYTGENYAYHKHFGSRDRGRFAYEQENRNRYEDLWVKTGRAKAVLKGFLNG